MGETGPGPEEGAGVGQAESAEQVDDSVRVTKTGERSFEVRNLVGHPEFRDEAPRGFDKVAMDAIELINSGIGDRESGSEDDATRALSEANGMAKALDTLAPMKSEFWYGYLYERAESLRIQKGLPITPRS